MGCNSKRRSNRNKSRGREGYQDNFENSDEIPFFSTDLLPIPCPRPLQCPSPCADPCPAIPELQSITTVNTVPQATTTTVGLINLGTQSYPTGTALSYTAPNTINFNEPGLYQIYYASTILLDETDNTVVISPVFNGASVPGASIYVTNQTAGDPVPSYRTFYLYVESTGQLVFEETATSTSETLIDFTVTVIKER